MRQPPTVPREFWDAPEMRNALATWHMGRVVLAYRHHPWHRQGLKQSVVGNWFGLTQTQLSRIENGRAPEEMSKLVRWAKLLGIPPELLWFKMPGHDGARSAPSSPAPSRGEVAESQPKGGLARRDFVLLATTVTSSVLEVLRSYSPDLPQRIARGSRVDGETAAGLESVMLGYRRIYQSAGAASLLDPVCGTLHLLTELAPGAGAYRDQIVSLIGQAGSLAATMFMLDVGDFRSASRYLAIAAGAAQQCGDQELLAITMAARAFHSAYGGDPADGLAFAREAADLASGGIHPRTSGWVSAVESEMHAPSATRLPISGLWRRPPGSSPRRCRTGTGRGSAHSARRNWPPTGELA